MRQINILPLLWDFHLQEIVDALGLSNTGGSMARPIFQDLGISSVEAFAAFRGLICVVELVGSDLYASPSSVCSTLKRTLCLWACSDLCLISIHYTGSETSYEFDCMHEANFNSNICQRALCLDRVETSTAYSSEQHCFAPSSEYMNAVQ